MRQTLTPAHLPVFRSDCLKLYFYALTAHFGQWVQDLGQPKPVWRALPGLLYAQVQKIHRRRRLIRVNRQMLCGSLEAFTARLLALGLPGHIQTAFIERVNLTLRRSLAPLARRSWSVAQLPAELTFHLEWWRAYYQFVRPHQTGPCPPPPAGDMGRCVPQKLDQPRPRGGRRLAQLFAACTPATLAPRCALCSAGVAIGLTQRPWSVLEVLSFPLPNN